MSSLDLGIIPRAHAELVEALLQLLHAELLVGAVLAPAVAVAQLELLGGLAGVAALEALDLEHGLHVVAEPAPVDAVVQPVLLDQETDINDKEN